MQVLAERRHQDRGLGAEADQRCRITRALVRALTPCACYIPPRADLIDAIGLPELTPDAGGDPANPFRLFQNRRNPLRRFYREVNESMQCAVVSGSSTRFRRGYDKYGQAYVRGVVMLNAFVKVASWDYLRLPNGQVYVAKINCLGPYGRPAGQVFAEIIGFEYLLDIKYVADVSNTEVGILEPGNGPLTPRLLEVGLREQARLREAGARWALMPPPPQAPAEVYDPPAKGLSSHLSAYLGHVAQVACNRAAHIRAFDPHRRYLAEVKILPDAYYEHAFVSRHVSDLDSKYGGSNVFYSAKDNLALCVRGFVVFRWYVGGSGRLYSTVSYDATAHIRTCGGAWSQARGAACAAYAAGAAAAGGAVLSSLRRERRELEEDDLERRDREDPALLAALHPATPPAEVTGYKVTYVTTCDSVEPCIVRVVVPAGSPVIAPLDADEYVGKLRTERVTVKDMWLVRYDRANAKYTMRAAPRGTTSESSYPGQTSWAADTSVTAGTCDPDVSKPCSGGIHFWPTLARALQFAGIDIVDVAYPPQADGRAA